MKKSSMMLQASILAAAGILTKVIGFIYRIPMANLLGEQGNGIYSVSFGIYNVALTLSSYSLPLAISKLVSARLAKNEEKNAFLLFRRALIFALIAGFCAFSVLFFGAEWLEAVYSRQGLAHPLRVLAPTAFVVALLGVFRGYFQGHSNMVPTALSQIIEQAVNAIVSIGATFMFIKAFENDTNVAARGAEGATVGTLAGALSALIMLTLYFATRYKDIKRSISDSSCTPETKRRAYTDIIVTMIPIVLSQTVYQIGFTVDDLFFGNIMADKGFADGYVSAVQGVFNTQYTQLINIPIAVATAFAATALPSVVNLHVQGKTNEKNAKITSVVKLTTAIAIPCAVGLAVLARPIITVLFPSLTEYREVAIKLLQFGSSACVFYSLSTITASVLQGNNLMRLPVINAFIAFILHVLLVYPLLKLTDLFVYALLIGDVTFPLTIFILNTVSLKKYTGYSLELKCTVILPLVISLIMGGVARGVDFLARFFGLHSIISLLLSIFFAVGIYAILILKFKVFTDEELPMSAKILRLKNKLLRKSA